MLPRTSELDDCTGSHEGIKCSISIYLKFLWQILHNSLLGIRWTATTYLIAHPDSNNFDAAPYSEQELLFLLW